MIELSFCPIEFQGPDFEQWIRLREMILREPLGLSYSEADIEAERNHIHLGCYDQLSGELLGGLILEHVSKAKCKGYIDSMYGLHFRKLFKMRQVAVCESMQGKGVGRQLVAYSERYAQELGATHLVLHARKTVIGFYQKLGYQQISEEFEEVGIAHLQMLKQWSSTNLLRTP